MENAGNELFEVKNAFWLGKYATCLKECAEFRAEGDRLKIENEVFKYRALICQGNYTQILKEINPKTSATELQIVRLLASALTNQKKEEILMMLNELLSDANFKDNSTLRVVAAEILCVFGDVKEALKTVFSTENESLEILLCRVKLLIDWCRVDLAQVEFKKMQAKDEDSTLTQLASGLLSLSLGGEQAYQEAGYVYQELMDKASALSDDEVECSTVLMCGMAAAQIKQGNFEEAMRTLQKAMKRNGVKVTQGKFTWGDISINKPGNVDLIADFITVSQHLRKTVLVQQCLQKLEEMFAQNQVIRHPYRQVIEVMKAVA